MTIIQLVSLKDELLALTDSGLVVVWSEFKKCWLSIYTNEKVDITVKY